MTSRLFIIDDFYAFYTFEPPYICSFQSSNRSEPNFDGWFHGCLGPCSFDFTPEYPLFCLVISTTVLAHNFSFLVGESVLFFVSSGSMTDA